MIPVKPFDRTISNIKYGLGKYYVRMGLTPLPKVGVCRDFFLSHKFLSREFPDISIRISVLKILDKHFSLIYFQVGGMHLTIDLAK